MSKRGPFPWREFPELATVIARWLAENVDSETAMWAYAEWREQATPATAPTTVVLRSGRRLEL